MMLTRFAHLCVMASKIITKLMNDPSKYSKCGFVTMLFCTNLNWWPAIEYFMGPPKL